ncbi:MAG: FtsX-like permease family protein [Longimicrobiaceae bacterium]
MCSPVTSVRQDGRSRMPGRLSARYEAIIDRTLATRFFPTGSPLGATLLRGGDSLTVIGVVEHARLYNVHQDDRPQVYLRNEQRTIRTLAWVLRTDRSPEGLIPDVPAAVRRVDPELAISDLQSIDRVVAESLSQQRLSAVLIGGFSLGALLLAAMGLFGVVAGSVTRRRHEIAVRLAPGADHSRVVRLVVGEGARLILLGLLLGVPGIYLSAQALRGLLVGVSPFDPLTLAAGGLALVALVACYVPARRVTAIEPAGPLRQE